MANWFDSNNTPQSNMNMAQLMMEQKLQGGSSNLNNFPPSPGISPMGNSSARRVYQPLMSMRQSPSQPNRMSSQFMNKTLFMLNNHAQQSRLNNLASVATNTSLALEMARKKKQQYIAQQMQQRQYKQGLPFRPAQHQPSSIVTTPSDVDVLLGRGGRSNHHIGNSRFRELIRSNRAQYNALPKHEKIKLSRAIVAVVQDLGGRFLEPADDGKYYTVAPNKRAVEKTSQCLREKRADGHHKSTLSAAAIRLDRAASPSSPAAGTPTVPQVNAESKVQQAGTTSKAA